MQVKVSLRIISLVGGKGDCVKEDGDNHHVDTNKGGDYVKDCVKDCVKELTSRQLQILSAIQQNNAISAKKLSEMGIASVRTIQNELAELIKNGYLVREGGRKEGIWVLSNHANALLQQVENAE